MQAARGASLSSSDEGAAALVPPRRRPGLVALVAVVGLALDQGAKALAVHALPPGGPPRHLVGSLLQLLLVRNPGAAFSTGTGLTVFISLFALVAAVVATTYAARARTAGWAFALGLLLAGIVGNLLDRIFRSPGVLRGHVVDFLALPHWPVFNLADVFIDVAAALVLLQLVRGVHLDGTRTVRTT